MSIDYNRYRNNKKSFVDIKNILGGSTSDEINDAVKREFQTSTITIVESDGKFTVNINCTDEIDVIFIIDDTIMHIDILWTCEMMSGTTALNKLINIAKNLNLQKIDLLDASEIHFNRQTYDNNCAFELSTFYILLHGKSWYNNFGFISESCDTEYKDHNEQIIKFPLNKFIIESIGKKKYDKIKQLEENVKQLILFRDNKLSEDEVFVKDNYEKMLTEYKSIDDYKKNEMKKIYKECDEKKFLENFLFAFPEYTTNFYVIPITEVVNEINKLYIKNNKIIDCSSDQAVMIKKLLKYAENIIKYSGFLSLELKPNYDSKIDSFSHNSC